jgi:apolipoprotein N-acyltransferase
MHTEALPVNTVSQRRNLSTSTAQHAIEEQTIARSAVFLPAVVAAGLLWCCYFPANIGWLAWIALVPLLILIRGSSNRWRILAAAYLAGLAFNLCALQWMRVADLRMYFSWIGVSFYCAVFFALAVSLVRLLERRTRLPLVLTFPAVWTGLEFLRAHLLGGFAWYFLGHTQHDRLWTIQITDITGVYGVSFLIAAVNVVFFEMLSRTERFRAAFKVSRFCTGRSLVVQLGGVLLLLAGNLTYGAIRFDSKAETAGPQLALLQGNLDQRLRNAANDQHVEDAIATIIRHYRDLCDKAARETPRPDLIVWPETSYPQDWIEISNAIPKEKVEQKWLWARDRCLELAHIAGGRWQTNVLMGMNTDVLGSDEKARRYNSAVLMRPDGEVEGRYDKIHRVPFGEYVPFRDWLPWLKVFAPYDWDYSIYPGETLTRFPVGKHRFGVLICYEDTDPWLARQYVRSDGEQVDFLVNISNDGWFDGTSEHEEHLAICRFRAIESRRAVVRAVNMGISAIIDSNGEVVKLPRPLWADSKKIEAVVSGVVPIDTRESFYARWGDWFPTACWIGVAVALTPSLFKRRLV